MIIPYSSLLLSRVWGKPSFGCCAWLTWRNNKSSKQNLFSKQILWPAHPSRISSDNSYGLHTRWTHSLHEFSHLRATWHPQKKQMGESKVLSTHCSSWDTFCWRDLRISEGTYTRAVWMTCKELGDPFWTPKEKLSLLCSFLGTLMWLTRKLQWLSQKQTQTKEKHKKETVVPQNSQTKTIAWIAAGEEALSASRGCRHLAPGRVKIHSAQYCC